MTTKMDFVIVFCCVLIGISIWLIYEYLVGRKQNQKLLKENERLKSENILLEAEHLKFQLQPHTLNNILTNLKLMSKKLNNGMDALSSILDYIVYKGDAHWISIQDEIIFINKYLELNELFTSEIDSMKMDDSQVDKNSKHYSNACIPHLISAYFLENAFKHGDKSHPDFLKVNIKLTDSIFEISIVNRIKQKSGEPKKSGVGLVNMKKRLDILMPGKYEINLGCNEQEYFSTLIIRF